MPEFALDEPDNLKGLIENHVGFVGLPQSVSGPLKIDGTYAQGDFYVPLCTVEGTLSLSMTRGFYLTHRSGGIKTRHVKQELSRAPVFRFSEIEQALEFVKQVIRITMKSRRLLRAPHATASCCASTRSPSITG